MNGKRCLGGKIRRRGPQWGSSSDGVVSDQNQSSLTCPREQISHCRAALRRDENVSIFRNPHCSIQLTTTTTTAAVAQLSSVHDPSDPAPPHSETAILDERDDAAVEHLLDSTSAVPATVAEREGVAPSSVTAAEGGSTDEELARFMQITVDGWW